VTPVLYINALKEHNRWQIDNSKSIIDDSRVTLQLVVLFMIIIYDCHLQLSCSYSTVHKMERFPRDKRSSIFGQVVSDDEKSFMTFPLGEHLKRAFEVCPSVRKRIISEAILGFGIDQAIASLRCRSASFDRKQFGRLTFCRQ
jgi:hypothetical protein